jgi:hypothetical protein
MISPDTDLSLANQGRAPAIGKHRNMSNENKKFHFRSLFYVCRILYSIENIISIAILIRKSHFISFLGSDLILINTAE